MLSLLEIRTVCINGCSNLPETNDSNVAAKWQDCWFFDKATDWWHIHQAFSKYDNRRAQSMLQPTVKYIHLNIQLEKRGKKLFHDM